MQEIHEWLNSRRHYETGVKLYMKHGNDPLLKQLFQEAYSDFKKKKLDQVMEQLSRGNAFDGHLIVTAKQFSKKIDEKVETSPHKGFSIVQAGWPKDMDATLQALYDQWLPLFLEKKNLQARIYDIAMAGKKDPGKKGEAGATANKILDLRDACRAIYENRDYYLDNKKLPEELKLCDIPDDPKKWPLTYQNYQRYVRDYKNKLSKLPQTEENKEKFAALQKQLAKYEAGVTELKKLLDL